MKYVSEVKLYKDDLNGFILFLNWYFLGLLR